MRWLFSGTAAAACGAGCLIASKVALTKPTECKAVQPEPENFMAQPITPYDELYKFEKQSMKHRMELLIMRTQRDFCNALSEHELDTPWRIDRWERKSGGGGISCIIQDGQTYEKAGVNISVVHGLLPEAAVKAMTARGKDITKTPAPFFACGVSCVIHPRNPYVPTVHFNYRYFEVEDGKGNVLWWFGGGTDLTPYYLDETDAVHFHRSLKDALAPHGPNFYKDYKKWCDQYFYLPHRQETRGIGGIFFDDLDTMSPDKCFDLVKSCAESTIESYLPIVARNKNRGFGLAERDWQLLRRGRYVEFNLIYDRGTLFGLRTPDARIESILMSLPATAKWEYCHQPQPGSPEEKMTKVLKQPVDWVPLDVDEK